MSASYETLLVEDDAHVRVVTLNRPERRNAWSFKLGSELRDALQAADADDDVRAMVVTGAGGHYSAGADMKGFADMVAGKPDGDPSVLARIDQPLSAFSKPLIAAVDGVCVGMAVTTLPFFDMVYASERATFQTPFVRIGLVLEMGSSFTLPRLIGRQRANELILRGTPIDAATAERWGLVTRMVPDGQLMDEVMKLARDVAQGGPESVADCKRLLNEGEAPDMEEAVQRELRALARAYASQEHRDAVAAFFSRKKKKKS